MSQYTANAWSQAPLSGHTSTELQRALDTISKHPDAYADGSAASAARRRLAAEISERVTSRLNKLNTTRKPQPLP